MTVISDCYLGRKQVLSPALDRKSAVHVIPLHWYNFIRLSVKRQPIL